MGGGMLVGGNVNNTGTFDAMSQHSRKKRRRKRNKNKQRVKSYLSSSSGEGDQDAQMQEEMIESCSSPDYTMQE